MATKIAPNTGTQVMTWPSLPQMPDEIFRRLASLNPDSVRALRVVSRELSRMGNDFLEFNAQEIVTLCSSADTPLYNQISLTIRLFSPTERSGIALHLSIPGAIRSLGLSTADCPDRILSSEEIPRFNDGLQAIQDVNLQRAWKSLRHHIMSTTPRLPDLPEEGAPAQEIRSWMHAHPAELQQITHLNLINKRLTCLPMEIGLCTGLRTLYLSNNELTSLPRGIFDGMSRLGILRLSRNLLTTLPEGIFDGLTRMEALYLNHNQLASFPEELFNRMPQLRTLHLNDNQLTSLPASLYNGTTLPALYHFYITNNRQDFGPPAR